MHTAQHLFIRFNGDTASLADGYCIHIHEADIPENFKAFSSSAYWEIKVLDPDVSDGRLFAEVLSYAVGDVDFTEGQKAEAELLSTITSIRFKSIDTAGLMRTIKGVAGKMTKAPKPEQHRHRQEFEVEDMSDIVMPEPVKPLAEGVRKGKYVHEERFSVMWAALEFIHAGLSGEHFVIPLRKKARYTITNYEIRAEFEAVKGYFANVLGGKKIDVTLRLEIDEGEVVDTQATSPQIARIDKSLIDSVKFEFVQSTIKKAIEPEIDKSLFTMDEYFEHHGDTDGGAFFDDSTDFFDYLMSITDTKHYKQLRYLSSRHAAEVMKLRFVHKPFSFIFLITGEHNYHVIWETLDTEEATWIWHFPLEKSALRAGVKRIEDIINSVAVQGKMAYITSTVDQFRRVRHDYSDLVDGFVGWKGRVERWLS